jgi:GT2 family glycosyltransferase
MLVRRQTFEEVGGFDEGYFMYFEDIDFCLRVRRSGGRVLYDPTITVTHRRGRSAATASELAERAYRESQLRFWRTHRGPWAHRLVRGYLAMTGRHP